MMCFGIMDSEILKLWGFLDSQYNCDPILNETFTRIKIIFKYVLNLSIVVLLSCKLLKLTNRNKIIL